MSRIRYSGQTPPVPQHADGTPCEHHGRPGAAGNPCPGRRYVSRCREIDCRHAYRAERREDVVAWRAVHAESHAAGDLPVPDHHVHTTWNELTNVWAAVCSCPWRQDIADDVKPAHQRAAATVEATRHLSGVLGLFHEFSGRTHRGPTPPAQYAGVRLSGGMH